MKPPHRYIATTYLCASNWLLKNKLDTVRSNILIYQLEKYSALAQGINFDMEIEIILGVRPNQINMQHAF